MEEKILSRQNRDSLKPTDLGTWTADPFAAFYVDDAITRSIIGIAEATLVEPDEVVNAYSALGENEILQQLDKLGIQRAMIDTGACTSIGPVQDNALL